MTIAKAELQTGCRCTVRIEEGPRGGRRYIAELKKLGAVIAYGEAYNQGAAIACAVRIYFRNRPLPLGEAELV